MAVEEGTPRRTVQGSELEKFAATIRRLQSDVQDARRLATANGALSGPTANRPLDADVGIPYLDLTLGRPIWSMGGNVWIDATGATV